jgi:hypothetical protein
MAPTTPNIPPSLHLCQMRSTQLKVVINVGFLGLSFDTQFLKAYYPLLVLPLYEQGVLAPIIYPTTLPIPVQDEEEI